MSVRWLRIAGVAAGLVLAAFVGLIPRAPGAQVRWVRIHGASMNPSFRAGDLVAIRPVRAYDIGDVIAFRSEDVGRIVMHRVVAIEGDRFVTRGDNNGWNDGERPPRKAILGKQALRVPAAVAHLIPIAAILALSIWFAAGTVRRRRGKRRKRSPVPRAHIAAGAGVAMAAVAVAAFASPVTRIVGDVARFTHQGRFTYSARVPSSPAYQDGRIETGEPVYTNVASSVAVSFAYSIGGDARATVGDVRFVAEVADGEGWRASFAVPAQTVSGENGARSIGRLDFARARSLASRMSGLTGVVVDRFTVTLRARADVNVAAAGTTGDEVFEPTIMFRMDPTTARLEPTASPETLAPVLAGTRSNRTRHPTTFLGAPVPVARAAASGLAITLLGIAAALGLRRTGSRNATGVPARYRDYIVDARTLTVPAGANHVAELSSLLRIAESMERPVLRQRKHDRDIYAVSDGQAWFTHEMSRDGSSDAAAG